MTKQCLCTYRLRFFFFSRDLHLHFFESLNCFGFLEYFFLWYVCLLWLSFRVIYLFRQPIYISWNFAPQKYCLSWSLLTFSPVLVRLAVHFVRLLCHYLALLVFVLNKVCLPLSPTDLGSLNSTDHTFYTPLTSHSPSPKEPFYCCFWRDISRFCGY